MRRPNRVSRSGIASGALLTAALVLGGCGGGAVGTAQNSSGATPSGTSNSAIANFSALAPGVTVSDVEHKTVVEVDESGTVAAGATTIGITVVDQEPQFTMTMDRPFLYAIQDDDTGELLFIGILVNPG